MAGGSSGAGRRCFVISIETSGPGPTGFIGRLSLAASGPSSLQRVAAALSNRGYSTVIEEGSLAYRPRHLDDLCMSRGWLLTWWLPPQRPSAPLESFGRVWVAAGADDSATPFTLT